MQKAGLNMESGLHIVCTGFMTMMMNMMMTANVTETDILHVYKQSFTNFFIPSEECYICICEPN